MINDPSHVLDTLTDCISSFGDVHGHDARSAAEYILSDASGLRVTAADAAPRRDLYTDSLYDLSLEEKIRQLERQSSYERLARLELSVENERLQAENEELHHLAEVYGGELTTTNGERDAARAELSDLYPAIESLRDELKRAKALLDPGDKEAVKIAARVLHSTQPVEFGRMPRSIKSFYPQAKAILAALREAAS
jgi:chromosome segregation ATPase